MFNSRNLGALIVAEEPHVKSWEDGQYNIQNMSIEETYGFGILQEGQAVAVAKNIKIRPNEFVCAKCRCFAVYTTPRPPSGPFATFAFRCRIWRPKPHSAQLWRWFYAVGRLPSRGRKSPDPAGR